MCHMWPITQFVRLTPRSKPNSSFASQVSCSNGDSSPNPLPVPVFPGSLVAIHAACCCFGLFYNVVPRLAAALCPPSLPIFQFVTLCLSYLPLVFICCLLKQCGSPQVSSCISYSSILGLGVGFSSVFSLATMSSFWDSKEKEVLESHLPALRVATISCVKKKKNTKKVLRSILGWWKTRKGK